MSILDKIQLDSIDLPDDASTTSTSTSNDDDISLDDRVDEVALEHYWEEVVRDLENDPDWFKFADE